jgi:hypothetical protein
MRRGCYDSHLPRMHKLAHLILLAATAPLFAQKAPAPAPVPVANSSLHGTVRDELTHKPLAGVRIQLVWIVPHSKIPRGTTTTSLPNGTYSFAKLASHPYFLTAEQPRYLRQSFFVSPLGEGQLSVLPGEDSTADIALTSEAAIDGTVIDPTGAPVAGVSVAAIRERLAHGVLTYDYSDDGSNQTSAPAVTDRAGHYRIGGLPEGTYAVLALHDNLHGTAPAAVAAAENGSLPVYLGGGFSLAHAARVTLNPDATYHANFKLTPRKRHMIRGTLHFTRPPEPGFEQPLGSMDEPFDGPRNFQPWKLIYDRKKATYELGPLVPGDYDLTMATGAYFEKDLYARKTITVGDEDLEHVDLTLSPRFSVNAKIVTSRIMPRGEKAALLLLHRDGDPLIEAGIPIDRTGALAFPNLEPGHYTLHLFSQEPFAIQSARFAGQDVLAHGLTLKGPSDAFLEVTLNPAPPR